MKLCLQAGRLDWDRALEEITPREFEGWIALSNVEPIGEDREDLRIRSLFFQLILWLRPELDPQEVYDSLNYLPTLRSSESKPAAKDEDMAMAQTRANVDAAMRQLGGS